MKTNFDSNVKRLLKIEHDINDYDIKLYEQCMFDTCTVCNNDQRNKCRLISNALR